MRPIKDNPKRSLLDRAIEYVSPLAAARREHARDALASYRGAIAGRFSQNWRGNNTSYRNGSVAERRSLASMRDRGRRAYHENVIAKALLDTETDYVVGDGFTLRMQSSSEAFNTEAERRFHRWLDKADITGRHSGLELQRICWRETRRDGDGALLLITRGGYPYLQYVPGDLIRSPLGKLTSADNARQIVDGVEVDATGRPTRFCIRDVDDMGKDTDTWVDARDVVWFAHTAASNHLRGMTCFAPIFGQLDQLDTYVDSVTKAAILGTLFGLVEKRKRPDAALGGLLTERNEFGQNQQVVSLENGQIKVHGTEDSVYQVDAKQPMQQTPEFVRTLARIAALGFDMPLEIAFRDVSQVNFSGGRIGLLGFYRTCRIKQEWLRARRLDRVVFWWLSVEKRRQELGYEDAITVPFPADYGEFTLHGQNFEANDPKAEWEAALLQHSMGVPMQQIFAERSLDYEDCMRQFRQHIERLRAEGLPVVLSTVTRDESPKTTAVDADGNPIRAAAAPLSATHLKEVTGMLSQLAEGTVPRSAVEELLERVGIGRQRAQEIADAAERNASGTTVGNRDFQRDVLKALLAVPQAREAVFNATDIEDLVLATGLPPEQGYQVPFAAVVAPTGPLNSGAVITDPEGDVVGADVENDLPADADGRNVTPPPSPNSSPNSSQGSSA